MSHNFGFSMRTVAAVLVSCSLLTAGCSVFSGFPDRLIIARHALTTAAATTLLSQADTAFARAATGINAAVDANSRCFFLLAEPKVGRAADNLLCGPVRVYGSSEKQVWIPFEARSYSSDTNIYGVDAESGVTLISDGPSFTPTELPTAGPLIRPDGRTPVTDAKLTAPKPPAAEPGVVLASTSPGPTTLRKPLGSGFLISPNETVKMTASAVSAVLGVGKDARSAAPGEEFVFARFAKTDDGAVIYPGMRNAESGPGVSNSLSGGRPQLTLLAGEERKRLPGDSSGYDVLPAASETLVLSVPKGKKAALELADEGKAQELDLRTGQHAGDQVFSPLYRSKNHADVNQPLSVDFKYDSFGSTSSRKITGTITQAALVPYVAEKKYAPPGSAWLAVILDNFHGGFVDKWDRNAFTVTPDGGAAIAGECVSDFSHDYLLFSVPVSFTKGTVSLKWTGTYLDKPIQPSAGQNFPISLPPK